MAVLSKLDHNIPIIKVIKANILALIDSFDKITKEDEAEDTEGLKKVTDLLIARDILGKLEESLPFIKANIPEEHARVKGWIKFHNSSAGKCSIWKLNQILASYKDVSKAESSEIEKLLSFLSSEYKWNFFPNLENDDNLLTLKEINNAFLDFQDIHTSIVRRQLSISGKVTEFEKARKERNAGELSNIRDLITNLKKIFKLRNEFAFELFSGPFGKYVNKHTSLNPEKLSAYLKKMISKYDEWCWTYVGDFNQRNIVFRFIPELTDRHECPNFIKKLDNEVESLKEACKLDKPREHFTLRKVPNFLMIPIDENILQIEFSTNSERVDPSSDDEAIDNCYSINIFKVTSTDGDDKTKELAAKIEIKFVEGDIDPEANRFTPGPIPVRIMQVKIGEGEGHLFDHYYSFSELESIIIEIVYSMALVSSEAKFSETHRLPIAIENFELVKAVYLGLLRNSRIISRFFTFGEDTTPIDLPHILGKLSRLERISDHRKVLRIAICILNLHSKITDEQVNDCIDEFFGPDKGFWKKNAKYIKYCLKQIANDESNALAKILHQENIGIYFANSLAKEYFINDLNQIANYIAELEKEFGDNYVFLKDYEPYGPSHYSIDRSDFKADQGDKDVQSYHRRYVKMRDELRQKSKDTTISKFDQLKEFFTCQIPYILSNKSITLGFEAQIGNPSYSSYD